MANLKYGSQGEDVKKLQESLGFTGKDVDGIFGKKTQKAVMDYQKANNLTVDGIAGKNTLGKLYGTTTTPTPTTPTTPAAKPTTPTTPTTPATTTPTTPTTKETGTATEPAADTTATTSTTAREDPLVQEAFAALQSVKDSTPGAYTSMWQDEMDSYLNQYENRDPFSYDFNADALYNQYKDQYILQGQMAMMDTMGQAAAMTGGYGNSYAQTVGQQAYNQQLNQLNEIMPQLYQMAYDRYNQEGQDLLNMYNIYAGLDERDYNRNQNEWDNWYKELDYATNNYNTLYNQVYGEMRDEVADSQWQKTFDYNAEQDAITNDQWQKTFDYNAAQDAIANDQWQKTFDYNAEQDALDNEYRDKTFNYGVEQDQKSEKNDNWNKLADLIGTGYEPTKEEMGAAGMTDKQYDALKKAFSTSGGNNGGSTGGRETSITQEEKQKIVKDLQKVENPDDLAEIANQLVLEGYSQAWVKSLITPFDTWGNPPEVDPNSYDGVRASVLEMANGEGKWMEIDNVLLKAKKAGYITNEEYKKLRDEAAKTRQNYAQGKYTK